MRVAKRKNLTRYDVLIFASMIEREAQLARERSLVSAVIYNRLKEGMPLGIDATIRYSTNNWQRPIRSRARPPGAVQHAAEPGAAADADRQPRPASMKAAAKPANKNYLFYVRKPGKVRRARVLSPRTRSSSATTRRRTRPRAGRRE